MTWTKMTRKAASLAGAALITGGLLAIGTEAPGALAATTTLTQMQFTSVAGGVYNVQNNEWGSGAAESITTDGNADFTVANSAIDNATNGAPGGYPSIYQGCHWGNCTSGGLSATPIQVSNITTGKVTTSWSTTQPGGSNDYDVAYDIWFNQTPTTTGQPNGTELMIWLNHNGPVQPFGSEVATNVSIGGRSYNVWEGSQGGFDTVSYTMTTGTTSVSGLDLAPLVQDAVGRGYTQSSWYLIDMEAGFELWQGGAGLATNSFSVDINGAAPVPATCSGTGSVSSSWSGGFQANIVVADTGGGPLNGWTLNFTLPSGETIASSWGGTFTQSGQSVTVTNAPYDGVIKQGSSTSIGFTANSTGTGTIPATIACT
jgi:Glycosyl hydrolase family 12/Cellulose binding domain